MTDVLAVETDHISELAAIERKVLWLSSYIVHWANHERPKTDGLKVGGHQASSASCVSLLTALYFHQLRGEDRIAVKPHASPVLYAISYLLGRLDRSALTELRAFGGLQSYPSQTKNPDLVDFSTGSVGLGASATSYAALTAEYARSKGWTQRTPSYWALLGDAELDEGNVWETVIDPLVDGIPGIRWIIDLNRQSLDRVVPGVRVKRLQEMFRANGFRVIEAKYGHHLNELFAAPHGESLRQRIDSMSNEEYQGLISSRSESVSERLLRYTTAEDRDAVAASIAGADDADLRRSLAGLGGNDLRTIIPCLAEADDDPSPAVVFAYTVKGWGLPFAGHPTNHSALMTPAQVDELAAELGVGDDKFADLSERDPGGRTVAAARSRLARQPAPIARLTLPDDIAVARRGPTSTQEAFGKALADLARTAPELSSHVVTTAPDVAVSTNLAGWINKVGVWRPSETATFGEQQSLLRWQESPRGQHLELGIAEMNLFSLLAQLGQSAEALGAPIVPIGTVYDPFVARGLDAFIYALYAGAKFIIVGTPSGVTLAPEGGAHQSTITQSIGIELPDVISYEPAFPREVEWTLLDAIRRVAARESSTYLRLSTLPVDDDVFNAYAAGKSDQDLRAAVLSGAYRLVDRRQEQHYDPAESVLLFATGVMVHEAVKASAMLLEEEVYASVFNVTSLDLIYKKWHNRNADVVRHARHRPDPFDLLDASELGRPAVTVVDGHPHAASFIGTALSVDTIGLGAVGFGQSSNVRDLYRHLGIDAEVIVNAAVAVNDR